MLAWGEGFPGACPIIGLIAPKEPSETTGPLLSIGGFDKGNVVCATDVVEVIEDRLLANAAP
jgi:hypothetical protein